MIKKIKSSLFAKVFLFTTLLLICVSFLVYGMLAWYMPRTYSNELNGTLKVQSQEFVAELEQVQMEDSGGLFDRFLQNTNVFSVELYDEKGIKIPCPSVESSKGLTAIALSSQSDDPPILSGNYYFSFLNEDVRYMLRVNGEAAQVTELKQAFWNVLPILMLVILVTAFVFAWIYSRIITRPVLKISRISREMSDLKLDWQLDEKHQDELGTLEKSLNTLSGNLSAALSKLQNANEQLAADMEHEKKLEQARLDFFSAVSHELKTPITVIKGQLEGMLLGVGAYQDHPKYLARSLEVVNTLETMVQEILTISRLETAADLKKEPFDCIPIIRGYLAETEDMIMQRQLEIKEELPAAAILFGNRMLLEKVFSNLLGNALKYCPTGGKIHIFVGQKQKCIRFAVENTGQIPEEYFPGLFEAFYRVEQSRSRSTGGSGLGLYIAQKILELHGSTCQVCNTAAGVQFSFELEI